MLTQKIKDSRARWRRRRREAKKVGLTHAQIAEFAGVHRSLISKCLAGKAESARAAEVCDQLIAERIYKANGKAG